MFDFFLQGVFHVHSGLSLPAEEHPPPQKLYLWCGWLENGEDKA